MYIVNEYLFENKIPIVINGYLSGFKDVYEANDTEI